MNERVTCERCGQPMFHLAQVCPHCGARRGGDAALEPPGARKPAALHLSPEEARALLSVHSPPKSTPSTLADVARDLLWPRTGAFELLTTVIAAPLTLSSLLALVFARLESSRGRREGSMHGAALLAVPATKALLSVTLWELQVPGLAWGAPGVSFVAWGLRTFARALADDGLH
jgi:hypothetical protein